MYTTTKKIVCLVIVSFFLISCINTPKENKLSVSVHKPIKRDWGAIEKEGVLRMITRYSSSTYFLYQGIPYGFEYELLNRFAQKHGLRLEVIVMKPNDNPYDLLNSGKGDIIAANYAITKVREQVVNFTRPYNVVSQILVFSDDLAHPPKSLDEVEKRNIPITVRPNSSYYHQLLQLQKQDKKTTFNINLISNKNHTEAILIDLSRGQYQATIADLNIFRAANSYLDHLVKGPVVDQRDKIAWAVRKNADQLRKKLNQFIEQHFEIDKKEKEVERSKFLNVLLNRYFNRGKRLKQYYKFDQRSIISGTITPFDELFKQAADSLEMNWLLLAAVAAQESHFNPNAQGWAGAVGLMQVVPRYTAVDSATLYKPKVNIFQGAKMLKGYLNQYSYIPKADRIRFALAAYNAGQGHLSDARRLTMDFSHNPNSWEDVSDAFLKLMERKFYSNARYGFCRGIITVQYVREVMSRYQTYQTVLTLASASES